MSETRPLQDEPGRYQVDDKPLAVGGMGAVWTANDRDLDRKVAVKSLRSGIVDHRGAYERLSRETRILSELSHPGICPIYDRYLLNDPPCYTMQLVDGQTLKIAIEEFHRKSSLQELRRLVTSLISIANTIAYTHGQGILHRDLKPENILLGSFGEVYVMDWGIASLPGDSDPGRFGSVEGDDPALSLSGDVLGTPAYASPEQMRGEIDSLDERTDVYGLGAILHEILTGLPPGTTATGEATATPRPALIAAVGGEIPADLTACCQKALSHDRQKRYPSAVAFRDELDRYLSGNLVEAAHYSLGETVAKWVQRNRPAVIAGGTIGAVALFFLIAGLFSYIAGLDGARRESDSALARALQAQGTFLLKDHQPLVAQELFEQALTIEEELGEPTLPAQLFLAEALRGAQQPVLSFPYAREEFAKGGGSDSFAYDPAANLLYCAIDDEVVTFDADSGRERNRFALSPPRADMNPQPSVLLMRQLILSPDRRSVALLLNHPDWATIEIRNAATGELQRAIETTPMVLMIRYRPSLDAVRGVQLAAVRIAGIESWDLAAADSPSTTIDLTLSSQGAYSFEYSDDGSQFLIGAGEHSNAVSLYEAESGEAIWHFGGTDSGSAYFLSDGERVIARVAAAVVLLDRETGEELDRLEEAGEVLEIMEVPGRDRVAVVRPGGAVSLLRIDDLSDIQRLFQGGMADRRRNVLLVGKDRIVFIDKGNRKWQIWGDEIWGEGESDLNRVATTLALHPTEEVIAVGGYGTLALHDLATRKKLASRTVAGRYVSSAEFHQDGSELLIASRSEPRGFRLDPSNLELLNTLPARYVSFIGYAPDGSEIVTAQGQSLLVIDSETSIESLRMEMPRGPWFASFSPDGDRILTTHHVESEGAAKSKPKYPLRVWNRSDGSLLREFDLGSPNYAARFTPDGTACFVGQFHGAFVQVDLDKGIVQQATVHESPILDHANSADGAWLLTKTYGGASRLIDTGTLTSRWEFEGAVETAVTPGRAGGPIFWATRGKRLHAVDPHYPERYRTLKASAFEAMERIQADPGDGDSLAAIGQWCLFRRSYSLARDYLLAAREARIATGTAAQSSADSRPGSLPISLPLAQACWCAGYPEEALHYYRAALAEGAITPYHAALLETALQQEIAESP